MINLMWITWWSIIATVRELMFCKVSVWEGYFLNWLRKNWPTLTSSPQWTATKYWIPPFYPPTRISEKIPPINMSRLKSWSPPFTKGGGGRKGGGEGRGNYETHSIIYIWKYTTNKSWPPIYADISIKWKILEGDMKWLNGCQLFSIVVIPYKKVFQQFPSKNIRWHQRKYDKNEENCWKCEMIFVGKYSRESCFSWKVVGSEALYQMSSVKKLFWKVATWLKERLQDRCFPVNIAKFLRRAFV